MPQDELGQPLRTNGVDGQSQTFQGQAGVTITMISAYQVVTDSPGKGLITAASQQQSFLIQEQDPVISPRQAFRRDLQRFLQQL